MMKLYSNEIVFRGHPDKVCDQISDALLDAYLKGDKKSRCGIEVVGGKGKIFITGEVTSRTTINVESVVKRVLLDIGYDDNYEIIDNIGKQSPDIALGTNDVVGGAGDNGMMFGYASRDTKEYLPMAMVILQRFGRKYDELRKNDRRFLPDGKAQITGIYDNNKLIGIKTFTVCYQNTEEDRENTDKIIIDICMNICDEYKIDIEEFLINPTGKFMIGGFEGDAGLTGRKISGAYKAREIAKRILLSNDDYSWCQVQLSYTIGMEKPLAIYIKTDKGDIKVEDSLYEECKPRNIIRDLGLLDTCYEEKAKFGHFIE